MTLCGVYLPEYRVLSSTETRVSELIMQHIPYDTYDPDVKQKKIAIMMRSVLKQNRRQKF